jgi:hypothetical protein
LGKDGNNPEPVQDVLQQKEKQILALKELEVFLQEKTELNEKVTKLNDQIRLLKCQLEKMDKKEKAEAPEIISTVVTTPLVMSQSEQASEELANTLSQLNLASFDSSLFCCYDFFRLSLLSLSLLFLCFRGELTSSVSRCYLSFSFWLPPDGASFPSFFRCYLLSLLLASGGVALYHPLALLFPSSFPTSGSAESLISFSFI